MKFQDVAHIGATDRTRHNAMRDILPNADGFMKILNELCYFISVKSISCRLPNCKEISFTEGEDVDKIKIGLQLRALNHLVELKANQPNANIEVHGDNKIKARCLVHSAEDGLLAIVKLLLEHTIDFLMKDVGLEKASRNGHLEVVKLLLEHHANVHAVDDAALRWASRNGQLKVVKLLLEHGANVHANDDYALRWASRNRHLKVVKLLKEHANVQNPS